MLSNHRILTYMCEGYVTFHLLMQKHTYTILTQVLLYTDAYSLSISYQIIDLILLVIIQVELTTNSSSLSSFSGFLNQFEGPL